MFSLLTTLRRCFRRALNLPGWETASRRIPSQKQWRGIFRAFTFREKVVIVAGGALVLVSALSAAGRFYLTRTEVVPQDVGNLTVAVIGRPLHINPVLAPSNAADDDLSRLLFTGLFRYDESGHLVTDLANTYAIGEFGKIVDVTLKEGILWPDGEPLIADDVVFTINAIKNQEIRSPLYTSWIGVAVEARDLYTVRFTLPAPYPPFLHNLTVGILPKHLWKDVSPETFALSEYNLKPMGLGPFRAARFERTREGHIVSYTLERNPASPRRPLLDRVTLRFFDQTTDALASFNRREASLVGPVAPQHVSELRAGARLWEASLPRTFALFLNQTTSKALADKNVRIALAHATDRGSIIETLGGAIFASALKQPIPQDMLGASDMAILYDFSPERANNVLDATSWTKGEDGIRAKKTDRLSLILTFREGSDMQAIADLLKTQWAVIGAALELRPLDPASYRKAVMDRDYQALLAGTELPGDPDPFAFWHSSQKFDPGGNLTVYDNKDIDRLLEESRTTFDEAVRAEKYQEFQGLLMQDAPAIFLWQPKYVSALAPMIRGAESTFLPNPSWRFGSIEKWYVQTKRVWK